MDVMQIISAATATQLFAGHAIIADALLARVMTQHTRML
jgi:hypothetical protein